MRERESESAGEWKQNTKSIKSFSSQLSWCTYYRRKWIQVFYSVGYFVWLIFFFHHLYLHKRTRNWDLYHILMSSTFFVPVDRFLDYVFRCLCQTDQELQISKDKKLEMKERSWKSYWSIVIVVRYSL